MLFNVDEKHFCLQYNRNYMLCIFSFLYLENERCRFSKQFGLNGYRYKMNRSLYIGEK